jgi:hypothetical protein
MIFVLDTQVYSFRQESQKELQLTGNPTNRVGVMTRGMTGLPSHDQVVIESKILL